MRSNARRPAFVLYLLLQGAFLLAAGATVATSPPERLPVKVCWGALGGVLQGNVYFLKAASTLAVIDFGPNDFNTLVRDARGMPSSTRDSLAVESQTEALVRLLLMGGIGTVYTETAWFEPHKAMIFGGLSFHPWWSDCNPRRGTALAPR